MSWEKDVEELRRRAALVRQGGGPKYRQRHAELARRQDDWADAPTGQEPVHVDIADRVARRRGETFDRPDGSQPGYGLPG